MFDAAVAILLALQAQWLGPHTALAFVYYYLPFTLSKGKQGALRCSTFDPRGVPCKSVQVPRVLILDMFFLHSAKLCRIVSDERVAHEPPSS